MPNVRRNKYNARSNSINLKNYENINKNFVNEFQWWKQEGT